MENSDEFNMTLSVEDFSPLLLPTPVDFNEDEILVYELLCVFRGMLYSMCLRRGRPSEVLVVMAICGVITKRNRMHQKIGL